MQRENKKGETHADNNNNNDNRKQYDREKRRTDERDLNKNWTSFFIFEWDLCSTRMKLKQSSIEAREMCFLACFCYVFICLILTQKETEENWNKYEIR